MKNSELQDLFVEYYPALKSFAVRYVGAAEVAEDLVPGCVFAFVGENESRCRGSGMCRLIYTKWCVSGRLIICAARRRRSRR